MLRTCVVFAVLALAQAQLNQGLQSPGRRQPGQYQQNNQFRETNQFQAQYQQPRKPSSQYQQQHQLQQQTFVTSSADSCSGNNERSPVPGSCDRYIECSNGRAEEKTCLDGLRFNPHLRFGVYPCQYPIDVPCLERSSLQPADPTEDCPHQFGYYRLGDASNCSYFRNCANGRGFDLSCPDGLAFNPDTYQCDWPDLVSDCDAEAFVGFRCPQVAASKELGNPAGYRYYRSDSDCQKYFVCVNGRPRRMSCGVNSGFDELTWACLSADQVDACPAELRARAAAAAAAAAGSEQQQRGARQNKFRIQLLK